MVALVLGLIVTGSALTLVLTNRQTFAATEDMGRVQEGVRLAFELLSRELRGAAGNPCDSSLDVYSGLRNPGAAWYTNWANVEGAPPGTATDTGPGLFGYGGGTAFPDAAFGTAEGQRIAGTDAIEVKAAVPLSADVAMLTTNLASPFDDDVDVSSTEGIEVGDLLLICNYVNATIFRVTGVDPGGGTIEHAEGAAAADNLSGMLPLWTTGIPAERYMFNEGSVVSRVHAARWYIGANGEDTDGDGVADGRSLYRTSLVNNGGMLGVSRDEIARGVTDMQVGYLVDGAVQYVDASAVSSFGSGSPVVGARVTLTLSGDDRIGPEGERIARTLTHTVAIRGRAE
jgi:type IV pilus assembly protein PilW